MNEQKAVNLIPAFESLARISEQNKNEPRTRMIEIGTTRARKRAIQKTWGKNIVKGNGTQGYRPNQNALKSKDLTNVTSVRRRRDNGAIVK